MADQRKPCNCKPGNQCIYPLFPERYCKIAECEALREKAEALDLFLKVRGDGNDGFDAFLAQCSLDAVKILRAARASQPSEVKK